MRDEGLGHGYDKRVRKFCTARLESNCLGRDALGQTSHAAVELPLEPVARFEDRAKNDRFPHPDVARFRNARAGFRLADRAATVFVGLSRIQIRVRGASLLASGTQRLAASAPLSELQRCCTSNPLPHNAASR